MPEKQARTQAEAMRSVFAAYDASHMRELATKSDMRETELRLQKEIEATRAEIKSTELRIIKWVVGTILTQTALIVAVIGMRVAILLS